MSRDLKGLRPIVLVLVLVGALLGCKKETKLKVTGMDPMQGDFGGQRVVFKGHNFKNPTRELEVYFGEKKAVVKTISDESISVDAPGGEVGSEVEVLLIFTPGGEITLPKKFKYIKHENADVGDLDTSK